MCSPYVERVLKRWEHQAVPLPTHHLGPWPGGCHHDVFSLEPAELGCTHSTKHAIKLTDDTPFTE